MTISVAPLTTTVLGAVETEHAGVASGINNVVSRAASLLAIAAFGVVVLHTFSRHLDEELTSLRIPPEQHSQIMAQRGALADLHMPPGTSQQDQANISDAVREAFVRGFRRVALLAGLLALLAALTSWLLIDGKARQTVPRHSRLP